MNNVVAETLLSLHVRAPLDACTYLGLDSAAKPVKNVRTLNLYLVLTIKPVKARSSGNRMNYIK